MKRLKFVFKIAVVLMSLCARADAAQIRMTGFQGLKNWTAGRAGRMVAAIGFQPRTPHLDLLRKVFARDERVNPRPALATLTQNLAPALAAPAGVNAGSLNLVYDAQMAGQGTESIVDAAVMIENKGLGRWSLRKPFARKPSPKASVPNREYSYDEDPTGMRKLVMKFGLAAWTILGAANVLVTDLSNQQGVLIAGMGLMFFGVSWGLKNGGLGGEPISFQRTFAPVAANLSGFWLALLGLGTIVKNNGPHLFNLF